MGVNSTIRDEGPFAIRSSQPSLLINVGRDLVAPLGKEVVLDGSQSYATDGASIAFEWRPQATPGETEVILENEQTSLAPFTPEVPGDYLFRLEIEDTSGRKKRAYKRITVSEQMPTIDGSPLEIRLISDDQVELRWPIDLQMYPEESSGLAADSWSRLVSESNVSRGMRRVTIPRSHLDRFFRLRNQE